MNFAMAGGGWGGLMLNYLSLVKAVEPLNGELRGEAKSEKEKGRGD